MPDEAPELEQATAAWAAEMLAEAARFAIARELGADEIAEVLARPCPEPRSARTDYSADLFLRYLSELLAWVQRLAAGDPLVEHLRRLRAEWTLPLRSGLVVRCWPGKRAENAKKMAEATGSTACFLRPLRSFAAHS